MEERPRYGPGRPSPHKARPVQAWRYGLKATVHARAEVSARQVQEAGCVVLLTNGPTAGEMAPSAGEVRRAYKAQPGLEQNCAFWKAPVIVNRLFLQQPERIAALGLGLLRALRRWRLVERARRGPGETTGSPWRGWAKKETPKPTALMMMTQCAAVLVSKGGAPRQLVHPLSAVHQHYLLALGVPATYFTAPQSG
jgi:hypothetical protein